MIELFPTSVKEGILINIISVIHLAMSHALPFPTINNTSSTNHKRQIPNDDLENFDRAWGDQLLHTKRQTQPKSCEWSSDCSQNEWCYNDKCEGACKKLDCSLLKDGGWCEVVNHQPVCFPEDPPKQKKTVDCIASTQCDEDNQFCDHNRKCSHVCPLTQCSDDKPPDGVCVIRNHLPQCVHIGELSPGEALHPNAGCVSSSECADNEWCYSRCENPCPKINCQEWYDDGYCDVKNHQPVCKVPANAKQREKGPLNEGEVCKRSIECKDDLLCRNGRCENPCPNFRCSEVGKLVKCYCN